MAYKIWNQPRLHYEKFDYTREVNAVVSALLRICRGAKLLGPHPTVISDTQLSDPPACAVNPRIDFYLPSLDLKWRISRPWAFGQTVYHRKSKNRQQNIDASCSSSAIPIVIPNINPYLSTKGAPMTAV